MTIIFENDHFTLKHTTEYAVAGYLIIYFKNPQPLMYQSISALSQFGNLIALATRCIEALVKPQKIYCLLFSEKLATPHFHLFPRTVALKKSYEAATGNVGEWVSGPDLFAWMMKECKGDLVNMDDICQQLRLLFDQFKSDYLHST